MWKPAMQPNAILRFTEQLTEYDPLLRKRVEQLYHNIFEGIGTATALDNLRGKVGGNELETEGDGVFGLAAGAGFEEGKDPEETLDKAIDSGVEEGNLNDFGTAIPDTTLPPTEEDMGFGSSPDDTFGNELGADESLFGDDTGSSSDLGLDGLDDEFDGPSGEDGDIPEEPAGDDLGSMPDPDAEI